MYSSSSTLERSFVGCPLGVRRISSIVTSSSDSLPPTSDLRSSEVISAERERVRRLIKSSRRIGRRFGW